MYTVKWRYYHSASC